MLSLNNNRPQGEGNVFTNVCLFIEGGGFGISGPRFLRGHWSHSFLGKVVYYLYQVPSRGVEYRGEGSRVSGGGVSRV